MRRKNRPTFLLLALLAAAFAAAMPWLFAAQTGFSVSLDTSQAQPRQVEDTTTASLKRDYGHAWQSLAKAMEDNRADLLSADFVGIARQKLTQAIAGQSKNGLRRRYIDHGHRVQVVFYSIDGSAVQLHDTANLELQYLDGDKVVHSEQATMHYIALLTPAENSWKVRVLESVSGF